VKRGRWTFDPRLLPDRPERLLTLPLPLPLEDEEWGGNASNALGFGDRAGCDITTSATSTNGNCTVSSQ
jgi:hypothetical protein